MIKWHTLNDVFEAFYNQWPDLFSRRIIRLGRAWAKNGSWSDNPSVYKYGQTDGSSIQTSYRDSPSCQTNYHGELVKTDDPSLCINAGRRRTIHKNYTSLQAASCCFQSHDTPIVRLIVRPVFILDG